MNKNHLKSKLGTRKLAKIFTKSGGVQKFFDYETISTGGYTITVILAGHCGTANFDKSEVEKIEISFV